MKQKHSKKTHSFQLAGAMMLVTLPYTATAVYASEETEIIEPATDEIDPTDQNKPSDLSEAAIVLDNPETNSNQEEPKEVEQPIINEPSSVALPETNTTFDSVDSTALPQEDKTTTEQEVQKPLSSDTSDNEKTSQDNSNNNEIKSSTNETVSLSNYENTNQEILDSVGTTPKTVEKSVAQNNTNVYTQSLSRINTNSLEVQSDTLDLDGIIPISESENKEAMIIVDRIYYGISKNWYEKINPENKTLKFSLTLPNYIDRIAKEAFNDLSTPDKDTYGCVGVDSSEKDSKFTIKEISIDFEKNNPIIEVPDEGMYINDYKCYMGISTAWYEKINPGGSKTNNNFVTNNNICLRLSLTIPDTVTYTQQKAFFESVGNSSKQGEYITSGLNADFYKGKIYKIVNIDFSKAINFGTLGANVAEGCNWLEGVIDLSHTKITAISDHAFDGTGIEGIILPENLKTIGNYSFYGCEKLKFVRTVNGDSNSNFELPKTKLASLGTSCFSGCTGLPDNTIITIPKSVTRIGQDAFWTSKITTIFVENEKPSANNSTGYHQDAFGAPHIGSVVYSLDHRMTIFENYQALFSFYNNRYSFDRWRSDNYSRSLTFKYTLYYYGTNKKETKLFGQPVTICEGEDGMWYEDPNYTLPEIAGNSIWLTQDLAPLETVHTVTEKNHLGRKGDILVLFNIQSIQFVVDGNKIQLDDERLDKENNHIKLNLSNDSEHTIGVEISSPSSEFSELEFTFQYHWLDLDQNNILGHRSTSTPREPAFSSSSKAVDSTKTTISINQGDERTLDENYSSVTQGYYQLEITAYFHLVGAWADPASFYQSSTTHGANDAFVFFVITSPPAIQPEGKENHGNVVYSEYDEAEISVNVTQEENHSYTYQWYEVPVEEPVSSRKRSRVVALSEDTELDTLNWRKLEGETSDSLSLLSGRNAGNYIYYLEVVSSKEGVEDYISFTDSKPQYFMVEFNVDRAQSQVQFLTDNLDKVYDKQATSASAVENKGNPNDVVYKWYKKDGDDWVLMDEAPTDAGSYKVIALVDEHTNFKDHQAELLFEISKAIPSLSQIQTLVIRQGKELSSLELPEGFAWIDGNQKANGAGIQTFKATFTPADTKNYEVLDVEIPVNVVLDMLSLNQAPIIEAKDITLPFGQEFTNDIALQGVKARDPEDGDLSDKVQVVQNTVNPLKAGIYKVTYKVTDKNGASATKTITVTVNPKAPEPLNEAPLLFAENKILLVGESFDPKQGVRASDKEDGDLSDKVQVVQNTVNPLKAGVYNVTYKVTDKNGASTTKTITVTIKEVEEKPANPAKPEDNSSTNNKPKPSQPNKVDSTTKPNQTHSVSKPNKTEKPSNSNPKPNQTSSVLKPNEAENASTSSLLEESHPSSKKESPHTAVESIQSPSTFSWSLMALPLLGKIKTFFKRKRRV